MDIFEAVEKRHSYRGTFTGKSIPREHLRKIVQTGLQAPSGCNAQTTSFIIVDDPGLLTNIGKIVEKPVVQGAKAIIICLAEHRVVYDSYSFAVEDCSAAVQNMLLAVTALGYATVWIDGALRRENRAARIADLLSVPSGKEVRVILPLGVPGEPVSSVTKKPFDERAWFNKYGAKT